MKQSFGGAYVLVYCLRGVLSAPGNETLASTSYDAKVAGECTSLIMELAHDVLSACPPNW